MVVSSVAAAHVLAAAVALSALAQSARAGSWNPVEVRRAEASPAATAPATSDEGPCVWSNLRGWHRTGWSGWKSCMPGPGWRYERRCWIGPANEKHCRFYG